MFNCKSDFNLSPELLFHQFYTNNKRLYITSFSIFFLLLFCDLETLRQIRFLLEMSL
jgi:hypothetical protein